MCVCCCNIPFITVPTCQHYIFPWITVNESYFIPCCRNMLHELKAEFGSISKIVRSQCKVLYRILEQHRNCQLEYICGYSAGSSIIVSIHSLIKEHAAKFHTSNRVADERMQTCVECFRITELLAEYQVFRSQYSLASHIIWIHAFPTTG